MAKIINEKELVDTINYNPNNMPPLILFNMVKSQIETNPLLFYGKYNEIIASHHNSFMINILIQPLKNFMYNGSEESFNTLKQHIDIKLWIKFRDDVITTKNEKIALTLLRTRHIFFSDDRLIDIVFQKCSAQEIIYAYRGRVNNKYQFFKYIIKYNRIDIINHTDFNTGWLFIKYGKLKQNEQIDRVRPFHNIGNYKLIRYYLKNYSNNFIDPALERIIMIIINNSPEILLEKYSVGQIIDHIIIGRYLPYNRNGCLMKYYVSDAFCDDVKNLVGTPRFTCYTAKL